MDVTIAPMELSNLWREYQLTHSVDIKNELMLSYMWVVRYVLQKTTLPVNTVLEEEDFLNIGMLGLNEAIERFDVDKGVKFETYAIPRVRGMIKDELRNLDWLSRSTRKKAQDFMNVKEKLSLEKGRDATIEEIMEHLQIPPEKYYKYLHAASSARSFLSLNDSNFYVNDNDEVVNVLEEIPEDSEDNFLNLVIEKEKTEFLVDYLKKLDDKRRLVMVLYYYEDMNFREIGADLGLSEGRVCQIHSQVINELRAEFKNF
ncbi:MAG: FliA/WhiG family RNA polymerase sigma factor [Bacteroidetes bacterium]|nr:FliA/WhiG family RNA polymerase sigma factor [Bacteroidota bacterium]